MALVVRFAPFAAAKAWRVKDFPYYILNDAQKRDELRSLLKYDHSVLIRLGIVHQTMHGLRLAWSYFPHAWAVQAGGKRTPRDVFNDSALLTKALEKRGRLHPRGKREREEESDLPNMFSDFLTPSAITASGIRKAIRTYTGTQSVSNFRPTAAAAIYHKFLPEEGGVTWDMSMGWGGRLLGAISCHKVKKYIGCDPSTETYKGLLKMRAELLPMARNTGRNLKVELHKLGSEMMRPKLKPNSVDLVFSSPPYFAQEQYSNEPTQSWVKYKTKGEWLTQFVGDTLANCAYCLKPDGMLAVNIADVSSHPTLAQEFVQYAEGHGWKLIKTMKLALSVMPGTRRKQKGTHKHEPIYIFRRK